ncbi:2-aminoethylphosphonate--pyruvate transaminase [Metabacillus arenae]|uniref:2-aminoethylphosphonate--pyruvate transaminase n=1 Tax=Metabacillus arenae TaxID=2771434 RepID=A0A926NJE3_9BACI|nr:2-aminoethylphosphonate--pyruvate transaminase [Metabacillus arenae]MBD1382165.1 2-aminoethylphosphonate--pyruvate transaminase [Metabacillus arenae]
MENPYLLLTPGPLSTSKEVRMSMLRDWCTWDQDYNELVQEVRNRLTALAANDSDAYTAVLMQGSGTFCVESVIGSVIPQDKGKLLIATNGAYGDRIVQMAKMLNIPVAVSVTDERSSTNLSEIKKILDTDLDITHVAVVHCETTTGMLNPIEEVCRLAKEYHKVTIVDAMSSFGGIQIDVSALRIDYLISSANKCIQGVPGFGFVIANRAELEGCKGFARSLSLDLYDQYRTMEEHHGKWRFTSPTHVVRAFYQALLELEKEGGVPARYERYRCNQKRLVGGMMENGFKPLLKEEDQSPIITSFLYPKNREFTFESFYKRLKEKGFVIYPGKISKVETFRIGNIGEVYPKDIERLVETVKDVNLSEGVFSV